MVPVLGAGERDGRTVLLYEVDLDVDSAPGPEHAEVLQNGIERRLNFQRVARRKGKVNSAAARELTPALSAERAPQAPALRRAAISATVGASHHRFVPALKLSAPSERRVRSSIHHLLKLRFY